MYMVGYRVAFLYTLKIEKLLTLQTKKQRDEKD